MDVFASANSQGQTDNVRAAFKHREIVDCYFKSQAGTQAMTVWWGILFL